MMIRYSVLPLTLYRMQSTELPKLRDQAFQFEKGQTAYDFITGENNLYNPIVGDTFTVPNGLSLRPLGLALAEIMEILKPRVIYELPEGIKLPEKMVLILERGDHYSLQTTESIKPRDFEKKAGEFFKQQKKITKNELSKKIIEHISKSKKK